MLDIDIDGGGAACTHTHTQPVKSPICYKQILPFCENKLASKQIENRKRLASVVMNVNTFTHSTKNKIKLNKKNSYVCRF